MTRPIVIALALAFALVGVPALAEPAEAWSCEVLEDPVAGAQCQVALVEHCVRSKLRSCPA